MPRNAFLFAAVLSLFACTSEEAEPPEDALSQAASAQDAGPAPPYVATFEASGTGCRPGNWHVDASPDGTTFTATFSEFTAEVGANRRSSVARCLVSIRLRSESPLSYAISRVSFRGYAYLDPGTSGRVNVDPYFQGEPVPAIGRRVTLSGPVDRAFQFDDVIPEEHAYWTYCLSSRILQVPSLVFLEKTQNDAEGYIDLSAVGSHPARIVTTIRWRRCTLGSRDAGTAALDGGVDGSAL